MKLVGLMDFRDLKDLKNFVFENLTNVRIELFILRVAAGGGE